MAFITSELCTITIRWLKSFTFEGLSLVSDTKTAKNPSCWRKAIMWILRWRSEAINKCWLLSRISLCVWTACLFGERSVEQRGEGRTTGWGLSFFPIFFLFRFLEDFCLLQLKKAAKECARLFLSVQFSVWPLSMSLHNSCKHFSTSACLNNTSYELVLLKSPRP